eukprot:354288-Chlamydomonas_euryale.AAC.3
MRECARTSIPQASPARRPYLPFVRRARPPGLASLPPGAARVATRAPARGRLVGPRAERAGGVRSIPNLSCQQHLLAMATWTNRYSLRLALARSVPASSRPARFAAPARRLRAAGCVASLHAARVAETRRAGALPPARAARCSEGPFRPRGGLSPPHSAGKAQARRDFATGRERHGLPTRHRPEAVAPAAAAAAAAAAAGAALVASVATAG